VIQYLLNFNSSNQTPPKAPEANPRSQPRAYPVCCTYPICCWVTHRMLYMPRLLRMWLQLCAFLAVPTCYCCTYACKPVSAAARFTSLPCYVPMPVQASMLRAHGRACKWRVDLLLQHQIYFCKIQMKRMQYSDKTYIWNAWNILRLLLKTLATWITYCNIHLKQVKYLKHTFAT
jgi:hypothetical protein